MKVFEGKILRIDLSPFSVLHEPFDAYRPFIGGRGVNQHILLSELPLNLSPFDPSNLLVIGAGALAGTDAPAACRLSVDSRNALTDGIGSSNCGGYFASEMRFAGVNHIVIDGTSSASHLSGPRSPYPSFHLSPSTSTSSPFLPSRFS